LAAFHASAGCLRLPPEERLERAPGETCESNEQCKFGACEGGYCVGGDCNPSCDQGWECVSWSGFFSSGSECRPSCSSDDDCPHTWGCGDGTCSFPRPLDVSLSAPQQGTTGGEVTFEALVTRSAGEPTFRWSVQKSNGQDLPDDAWEQLDESGPKLLHAFPLPGVWIVRVDVADEISEERMSDGITVKSGVGSPCDASVTESCEEELTCFESPSHEFACYPPLWVSINTESSGYKIPPGEQIDFEASWPKLDPDPAFTFTWTAAGEPLGTGPKLTAAFTEPGTFMLRLHAKDDAGREAEDEMELIVCANVGAVCDDNTYCCGDNSWCHTNESPPTCHP
jgi:hypothetical protein